MNWMKGFIMAALVSFAILAIWYRLEWMQFGELQWNRKCDDVVFALYFLVLWYLFSK